MYLFIETTFVYVSHVAFPHSFQGFIQKFHIGREFLKMVGCHVSASNYFGVTIFEEMGGVCVN